MATFRKSTAVLAFLLSLCFALSSVRSLSDTDGHPLRNGGTYHLQLIMEGFSVAAGKDGQRCPVAVYPSMSVSTPVQITTPPKILFLSSHNYLDISVTEMPHNSMSCTNSTHWRMVRTSAYTTRPAELLFVGDGPDFPGDETIRGAFRIKPSPHYEGYYKFVFCTFETEGEPHCRDVGMLIDNHRILRLGVADQSPVAVKFVNAQQTTTSASPSDSRISMVV